LRVVNGVSDTIGKIGLAGTLLVDGKEADGRLGVGGSPA
jgi:hypothetical protein